jgi:hypothetical protein
MQLSKILFGTERAAPASSVMVRLRITAGESAEKLKLPKVKDQSQNQGTRRKIKTANPREHHTTSEAVLEQLSSLHALPSVIINFRHLTRMRTTCEAFPISNCLRL